MTEAEHEERIVAAIMQAIGEASTLDGSDPAIVAIHVNTVARALRRCSWIVERLGEQRTCGGKG
ncbi:hypothetical protein QA639_25440 [Bradyrhizobium pachyrhizi]|uniref:hypothetical protein n=1 Tax=Bradyrhizobium pachyrhizi TaxID=280333 RepID=UPI0024B1006B|nr:hypothetical protein [Bradyrhizobium pachyrhizi]WFU53019.1 hypothetical protein QA639_25440 [Bradyrhizobium pachyrhizi]